jgi:polysaccharide export outer membrane protein
MKVRARPALAFLLLWAGVALSGCLRHGEGAAAPVAAGTPLPPASVLPGDRIALKVFQEEEMSDTFNVAENGVVILPRLGAVPVAGSQVSTLQDSLRLAYGRYLRNPAVEVTVLRRIGVHGEVEEPGLYLVDLTMTLRDLIARAGGITDGGDPDEIYIVRGGERIRFGRGETARFVTAELRSGDQVLVGQRPWIERNSLAFASTAATVIALMLPILRSVF